MPVPTNNENAKEIGEVKQRLAVVEQQQRSLEERYQRLQKDSDDHSEDMKADYVSKTEFKLTMENQALTIANLKLTVDQLVSKVGVMETSIVSKVEDVAKAQRKAQTSFLRQTIAVQAAILLLILGAFLAFAIPFILSHH